METKTTPAMGGGGQPQLSKQLTVNSEQLTIIKNKENRNNGNIIKIDSRSDLLIRQKESYSDEGATKRLLRHSVKKQTAFTNTVPRNDGHVCHAEQSKGFKRKGKVEPCHCEEQTKSATSQSQNMQNSTIMRLLRFARNDKKYNSEQLTVNSEQFNYNKKNASHFTIDVSRSKDSRSDLLIRQKVAFTLAEVLITLSIIGVVAALTMPSIIAKIQKQQYIAGLKKAYSVLSQATTYVNMNSNIQDCVTNDSECLAELYKPYLKYTKEVIGKPSETNLEGCWGNSDMLNSSEQHVCVIADDGIIYDFDLEDTASYSNKYAYINIDVNGLKEPNVWGLDRYAFAISKTKAITPLFFDENYVYLCADGQGSAWDNLGCSGKYLFGDK